MFRVVNGCPKLRYEIAEMLVSKSKEGDPNVDAKSLHCPALDQHDCRRRLPALINACLFLTCCASFVDTIYRCTSLGWKMKATDKLGLMMAITGGRWRLIFRRADHYKVSPCF